MDGYLDTLASDLMGFYGNTGSLITLTQNVEPVIFDIDMAIPCGLIVTELFTNALKDVFPSGTQGAVEIGLRV